MSKEININQLGGTVSWVLEGGNLMLGTYDVTLLDSNDIVQTAYPIGDNAHLKSDTGDINFAPNAINDWVLWFKVMVQDPTYNGGAYTFEMSIYQDGKKVDSCLLTGNVSKGIKKCDIKIDEIKLKI